MRSLLAALLMFVLSITSVSIADVRLPAFFGNGMVVQQNLPIRVWGWADAGEQVTVTLGDASQVAQGGKNGSWRVELPAREARAPHAPLRLTVAGRNTLILEDILIGEVWLCSGQSNMALKVAGVQDAEAEIEAANYPHIRFLQMHGSRNSDLRDDARGTWAVCSPKTVRGFSAVAYFFGREVHRELNVPVGLINSSVNGTVIASWVSADVLGDAHADGLIASEDQGGPKGAGRPQSETATRPVGRKVQPGSATHKNSPGVLYKSLIGPLTPMGLRGVIWYQGEANTRAPDNYGRLLRTLVSSWRSAFENPHMYFGIVQLANYGAAQTEPSETRSWADLRDAQRQVADSTAGVGLAVTIDIGEERNIHPLNKQDVGRRLAAGAIYQVYRREGVTPSGPVFKRMVARDGKLILSFTYSAGLALKGGKAGGFVIAGADGKFHFADAIVENETVVVSSQAVPDPVAVRYAWANNPRANLYNGAGLPAVPFRTDLPKPAGAHSEKPATLHDDLDPNDE